MKLKPKAGRAHRGRRLTDEPQKHDTTASNEADDTTAANEAAAPTPQPATPPASTTAEATTDTPARTEDPEPPAPSTTTATTTSEAERQNSAIPPRANGANPSGRFAVAWQDDELDTLRAVYEYAYQHPEFAPEVSTSISDYLADVLTAWAKVPARRRTTLMSGALASQRAGGSKPRSYAMPDDIFLTVDHARAQDAELQDRFVGRSAFARAALAHARITAEAHNGHKPLPVPPERGRRGPRTDPRPTI